MQTFGYNPNGSINLTNPVSPHFGGGETARLTEHPAKPIDPALPLAMAGAGFLLCIAFCVAVMAGAAGAAGKKGA